MVHCFDALTLAALTAEFQPLRGGRLQRITQGEGDTILLHCHSREMGEVRLLLSCHPRLFRTHFTWREKSSAIAPATEVMFLRKYLEGSTIRLIFQPPLERMLVLEFGRADGSPYRLSSAFMGQRSNLVLTDGAGRTMLTWRRTAGSAPPTSPCRNKADWSRLDREALADILQAAVPAPLDRLLPAVFAGMSPILAREILARCRLSPAEGSESLSPATALRLGETIAGIAATLRAGSFTPTLALDERGKPLAFAAIPLEQYRGLAFNSFSSMSRTLDEFYAGLDRQERLAAARGPLRKSVETKLNRCRRKESVQNDEANAAAGAEGFLRLGRLLTANLHRFPAGQVCPPHVFLPDYENAAGEEVRVPLDSALTAVDNAQKLFRQYRKLTRSRAELAAQLERTRAERTYLEGILSALEAAEDIEALREIGAELAEQKLTRTANPKKRKPPAKISSPRTFLTSEGLVILVGKNNRQNEELTFRVAAPGDLWFHAKEIPGSHCILRLPPGREASPESLLQAAAAAAHHSAARGEKVPVDYTQVRHVRKIPGGKPGQVRYAQQRTIMAGSADLPAPAPSGHSADPSVKSLS